LFKSISNPFIYTVNSSFGTILYRPNEKSLITYVLNRIYIKNGLEHLHIEYQTDKIVNNNRSIELQIEGCIDWSETIIDKSEYDNFEVKDRIILSKSYVENKDINKILKHNKEAGYFITTFGIINK